MPPPFHLHAPAAPHAVGDLFPVRNVFAYDQASAIDPFLLLDYLGPATVPPSERPRGVCPHPHRGFETVTIVLRGEVAHRDSAGNGGTIGAGGVQWMTAGAGVVHSEFHGPNLTRTGGELEMVQLWVNLPARHKLVAPRYQDLAADAFPSQALPGGGNLRVLAGEFAGVRGPARTHSELALWDVALPADAELPLALPPSWTRMVLLCAGEVAIGGAPLRPQQLARLPTTTANATVRATVASRLLVLAGAPIGEPVVAHGPFVMNTKAEIHQAIDDFHSGRMGRLDG
jgi:quercetin 2,3-dioxygenase